MAPKRKSRIAAWYDRWSAFNVEQLFSRKRPVGPPRTVFFHQELPQDYYDKKQRVKKEHVYATNQVITSKYTIITFIPRNLLEQFRRVANCFFLAIAILQFFSLFSTVSPGLVILPLLIVLAITALKDGYEDIKRHQSDRQVNYSQVRILAGGDFVNPNAMEGKSKTFVRGFVPKFTRRPKKKNRGGKHADGDGAKEGDQLEVFDGIEYDDATPVEEVGCFITTTGRIGRCEDLNAGQKTRSDSSPPSPAQPTHYAPRPRRRRGSVVHTACT